MNYRKPISKQVFDRCKHLVLLLVMLLPLQAFAQDVNVSGTVVDGANGEPIIGATVRVKGSAVGAVTDLDGNFSLSVKSGQTIEVSYVGYITKSLKVSGGGKMNITLSEDAHALNEVVVVGYGVMKRSDLTGSVASINEEAIKQGVNTSLEQAMQGRIAGVQVMQNSGAPGGGISVQIRGINSLNGNEPLYVVDGIAMSGSSSSNTSVLSSINPSDITSIEVLKDASATAIYGSRASNGVVLITTKRGQEGKARISYEGYVGWQQLPKKLSVMNLPQYAEFYNVRAAIQGWGEQEAYKDPSLLTNGTDWQSELFQTAFMHNHNVNINGGNKDMHYSLSGGFLDQDGVGIGSGFTRASFRANFDTNVTDWMQVGFNTAYANTRQIITFDESNVISTALNQFPDMAPRNPDGTYGFPLVNDFATYYNNPIFEAQMKENRTNNYQLDYNVYANIKPIKGLNIRIEYGGNRGWFNTYKFEPEYTLGTQRYRSSSTRAKNLSKYNSFKQYATYDFEPWKGHHFQIMGGHEAQWGNWESLSGTRMDFLSSALHSLNVGDASTATNSGDDGTIWSIESYFGRLNYNLLDRYLITATLRGDGSSSFGGDNKWGVFPSAALAWRISNEPFMKKLTWVNNLKLRLGWGLVGNQSAGTYAYGATMANTATAWGTGHYPANFPNSKLKWESTRAWNVGLDLTVLKNRIELIIDAYLKKTNNLLMQAALPSYVINNDWMGMSAPWVNTGSIENRGIEFTLNTVNIDRNGWQWRTGATLSFNRNKLTGLNSSGSAIQGTISTNTYTLSEIGGPVGRFYGYNVIGMFKDESDFYQKNRLGEFLLDESGNRISVARPVDTNGNLQPIAQNSIWVGDYIFEDVNGDGKITEADRKYIGDPNPDFTFGLNNIITWKDFELSFFLNGSVGGDIYNLVRQQHTDTQGWGNKMSAVAQYAHVDLIDPNGSATDISNVYVSNASTALVQRISAAGTSLNDNNRVSSRFVEGGSYLRLKSLSLAWNLPKKWLSPLSVDWVQVYGNIQNLFTICGYDGYDPEIGAQGQSVILQGIDNYRYPSQRIYTLGLKVKF
ncbi:MAG: TonB-dependent receptor [Prevotella sp.]|nr:TonB-dependent receptor [Prevotella sp.]